MKTAIDLHLDHPPEKVVRVNKISDTSCGMYPSYYIQRDSEVWASTSAVSLIQEMGTLKRNPEFSVPEYITSTMQGKSDSDTVADKIAGKLPADIRSYIPSEVGTALRKMGLLSPISYSWNTIDSRIYRMRPFETVTSNATEQKFEPTHTLDSPNKLAQKTAEHMIEFVNRIEERFPDREHVILTGGKDSQLISLIPKITEDWHIFSADPNYPLVKEFVEKNGVDIKNVIRDDNQNRESTKDLQRKLLASDLLVDPRHLRWITRLKELTEELNSRCIFWNGDGGGELLRHRPDLHYPETHLTRVPSKQGMYHQTVLNATGTPILSPYHAPKIWDDVFKHYNPAMMSDGVDVRPQIGEILYDDSDIWWPEANPTPDPYQYELNFSPVELFLSGLYENKGIERVNYPN